ncbi:MAG: triose-phosphate isomerase [Dorea sp.]|nr:triose-phosphate isomerase [Dorea sp.]
MEKKEIESLVRKHIESKFSDRERKEYIVAANWKMNMSAKEIRRFIGEIKEEKIPNYLKTVIFPPYPYLPIFQEMLRYDRIIYGAQDVAKEEQGAYTGEVSAAMLADCGCSYTLVGHSERRGYYAEAPGIVAKKAAAALRYHIKPVICIGETLEDRQNNRYRDVLKIQLDAVRQEIGDVLSECVIAYEPVWAIGTGVIPELVQIEETHHFIHELLVSYTGISERASKILYGGSVNEKNVKDIAAVHFVDGFLIGGASLKAGSFINILRLLNVDGR